MVEEGLLKGSVFNKVDINNSNDAMPLPEFHVVYGNAENLRLEYVSWKLQKTVLDNFTEDEYEVFVCNSVGNLLSVKLIRARQ